MSTPGGSPTVVYCRIVRPSPWRDGRKAVWGGQGSHTTAVHRAAGAAHVIFSQFILLQLCFAVSWLFFVLLQVQDQLLTKRVDRLVRPLSLHQVRDKPRNARQAAPYEQLPLSDNSAVPLWSSLAPVLATFLRFKPRRSPSVAIVQPLSP